MFCNPTDSSKYIWQRFTTVEPVFLYSCIYFD